MSVRVLVVDDSRFFRRMVTEMLETDPQIKVIDSAGNGADAVKKAGRLKPDVIIMDVEMPVMDGITATRKIMASSPTAILMFSSLTRKGAQATLNALEAGAIDFLPKRFDAISNDGKEAQHLLCERVRAVAGRQHFSRLSRPAVVRRPSVAEQPTPQVKRSSGTERCSFLPQNQTRIVVIGTSTGGPIALQQVLKALPATFSLPILLVQHMPGSFTTAFAQRLDTICAINIREAKQGDILKPGLALLAPGGKQMLLERQGSGFSVRITESEPGQNYKPCVDITFSSVAKLLPGKTLAIVLTGMGADGREGAKLLKQAGSAVWVQDEASSIIYGMPAAIAEAGLADRILPLDEIGVALAGRI
jgi:two-component system chemotaxis response regulator CheB